MQKILKKDVFQITFDKNFLEKAVGINGTEEERQIGAAGMNAPMYDINNPKYKNVL